MGFAAQFGKALNSNFVVFKLLIVLYHVYYRIVCVSYSVEETSDTALSPGTDDNTI